MYAWQFVDIDLQDKRIQNIVGFIPEIKGVKLQLAIKQEAIATYEAFNARGIKRGYAEVYKFRKCDKFPQDDIGDSYTRLKIGEKEIPFSIYFLDDDAKEAIWAVMMDSLETEVEI